MFAFSAALLNELMRKINSSISIPQNLLSEIKKYDLSTVIKNSEMNAETIERLMSDLVSNSKYSLVHTGDNIQEDVHVVVNLINEVLGNEDLFNYESSFVENRKLSSLTDFDSMIENINCLKA